MVATLVADLLTWLIVAVVVVVSFTIIVIGTMRAYREMRAMGKSEGLSIVLAAGAAVVLLGGVWLLVGLYWFGAWLWRMGRRASVE